MADEIEQLSDGKETILLPVLEDLEDAHYASRFGRKPEGRGW